MCIVFRPQCLQRISRNCRKFLTLSFIGGSGASSIAAIALRIAVDCFTPCSSHHASSGWRRSPSRTVEKTVNEVVFPIVESVSNIRVLTLTFLGVRFTAIVPNIYGGGPSYGVAERSIFNTQTWDYYSDSGVEIDAGEYAGLIGPRTQIEWGGGFREWRFQPVFETTTVDLTTIKMNFERK